MDRMNIAVSAVLLSSLALIGIGTGHAQGTMSGMTNSMRSSPLMAPAGQGQGPHEIGKGLATEDQIPSGNGEGRPDSMRGANPGHSSGTAGDRAGASTGGDRGEVEKGRKPGHGDSGGAAPMLR
jgi:hypothetical protein